MWKFVEKNYWRYGKNTVEENPRQGVNKSSANPDWNFDSCRTRKIEEKRAKMS